MNVIFISNYLNYHQTPLWDAFILQKNVSFKFISTDLNTMTTKPVIKREYNVCSSVLSLDDIANLMNWSDVIIFGDCKDNRFFKRIPRGKIIFHNSEHYWKKINTPKSFMKRLLRMMSLKKRYCKLDNFYLLANSSRLKKEFDFFGIKYKACFRFGYFPPVNCDSDCLSNKKDKKTIYIGRAIYWKRIEMNLVALEMLQKKSEEYFLNIYSNGPWINKIKKKAKNMENVFFNDFIKHEDVIKQFKESEIFVFGSNREEGWGATLNEALSCGCITFCSSSAGSTNFLINDRVNGFVFGSKKELLEKIKYYLSLNDCERKMIRQDAFDTINNVWNEREAANRLYNILCAIINKQRINYYKEGPMSIQ